VKESPDDPPGKHWVLPWQQPAWIMGSDQHYLSTTGTPCLFQPQQACGRKIAGGDPAGKDWKKSLLIDMSVLTVFGVFRVYFAYPTNQSF